MTVDMKVSFIPSSIEESSENAVSVIVFKGMSVSLFALCFEVVNEELLFVEVEFIFVW